MRVKEESEKVSLKLNIQKMKIMASRPITSWQIEGRKVETVTNFILGSSKITADSDCSQQIKRCLLLGRKAITNLDSVLKCTHHLADKGPDSQSYGFSGSHVRMWEENHKEDWAPKELMLPNLWCWMTLRSPLNCKEIKSVNPKGNQPWIFTGRTDAEAEAPILWPPDTKRRLNGKDPDAKEDWGEEE